MIIAAGLLLIGGLLVINQQMNIGQFVASEIIIILILASIEKLIVSVENIYDVLTAIEKIGNITDIPIEEQKESNFQLSKKKALAVELNNFSYRFPDANDDILKNIQLKIAAGEKLCISGFNGSGKSLLLQIIAGLYDDFTGSIAYENIPLGNWSKEELRTLIGDSLAKEDIFKGTLLENIALGKPDISLDQVQEVVDVVGLTTFVQQLPKGFETVLIPEGKNLPQSIRQKIMLARSIASDPKLILLEDNFNQLNEIDKTKFIDYLIKRKSTVIVVSNDPIVAEKFDRIIVLDKGNIIAKGKLAALKRKKWFQLVFKTK